MQTTFRNRDKYNWKIDTGGYSINNFFMLSYTETSFGNFDCFRLTVDFAPIQMSALFNHIQSEKRARRRCGETALRAKRLPRALHAHKNQCKRFIHFAID